MAQALTGLDATSVLGWSVLWLFPVGVVAGIVNTLAGGGSFITLSAMIWLGMPAQVANATNRVGVLAQSGAAAWSFERQGIRPGTPLVPQALAVCGGALAGAGLSAVLDPATFERVLALAMLGMLGLTLMRPKSWTEPGDPVPWRWPALVLAGAYGGFLQAGVGVLLMPALVLLGGLDLVHANARKVVLVAWLTMPALVLFAVLGWIDVVAGAVLAAGSAVGGWVGGRLTVGGGARFVWGALVVVVVLTASRLLFF